MRTDKTQMLRLRIAAEKKAKERDYWLNRLSGELVKSRFPAHYNYKRKRTKAGAKSKISLKFSDKLSTGLLKVGAGSDVRLYIILAASLTILINKYTGCNDIIVGTPILKSDNKLNLINTVVALRNHLEDNLTVKELLLEVQQTILEANKNRNYPLEVLIEQLNLPLRNDDSPLFDVAILVENVHDKELFVHVNPNMVFSFLRTGGAITGYLEYNSLLYSEIGVKRIMGHFRNLLGVVLESVDIKMVDIEILTEEEKKQLLVEFNDTASDYPYDKTIHELFVEQAESSPGRMAVIGLGRRAESVEQMQITYHQLNEKSNQIAHLLRAKGVGPDSIVAIMVDRSIEMLVGILGILKAGGAYLPIELGCPRERIDYMLADSKAKVLLTAPAIQVKVEVIDLHPPTASQPPHSTGDYCKLKESPLGKGARRAGWVSSSNLAYIIYTSGTTGRPKGVLTTHYNVTRVVRGTNYIDIKSEDRVLQLSNYAFDGSVFDIYGALLNSALLAMVRRDDVIAVDRLSGLIKRETITMFFVTTALFNTLVELDIGCFTGVRKVLFGGERISVEHSRKALEYLGRRRIIHVYGPTETTVFATFYFIDHIDETANTIPIGKPISNTSAYILDRYFKSVPVGVNGEIYIGGTGTARGYLNNPELTAEKFRSTKDQCPMTNDRLYRTGDLAFWLPDGNIEFLGRMDHQVKIRGFRIELGEIENQLIKHPHIGAVVVEAVVGRNRTGAEEDKYLCAYVVPAAGAVEKTPDRRELKEFLSRMLPDYMVPSLIISLDKIPLTPSGKLDRKALPAPETFILDVEYTEPRDAVEAKLAEIWSEVLNVERIGINNNFFELGGHSLRATTLTAEIYKTFNVNVTLAILFKKPTIRELAGFIKKETTDEFAAVEPVEEKDYYLLSPAQKRLYILQQSDKSDMCYNMPQVMELEGELTMSRLENTFKKLIERHESFRTSFEMHTGVPVQRIYNHVEFEVEHFSVEHSTESEEHLVDIIQSFVRPFDLSRPPLLRVGLIHTPPLSVGPEEHPSPAVPSAYQEKNSASRYILMVDMHHCITDGSSMRIFVQEFMALQVEEGLPPLQLQYKDFSEWVNSKCMREVIVKQQEYWLKEFEEEVPTLQLFADEPDFFSHSQSLSSGRWNHVGKRMSFQLDRSASEDLKKLAKEEGVTVYMALLAIYNVLLFKASRLEDIVVGTVTAGRSHPDLQPVIGMFVNTLALRNYPGGEKTFREFLKEVKEQILKAFENQAYPFDELAEKAAANRDSRRNPLFDVMFTLQDLDIPKVEIPGLTLKSYEYENVISKFDLSLNGVEADDKFVFRFEYRTDRFKEDTIAGLADHYLDIIANVLKDRDVKLADIKLSVDLSDSEADAKAYQEAYGDFEF
jgi:tyrocidine synthetase-3